MCSNYLLAPDRLTEELSRFPLRTLRILRDIVAGQKNNLHILDGSIEIQGLIHVI
jgi:hypothetical protein